MTNWTNFLVAYLAVFLIFGGAAGFFGFHDKVYHYDFREAQADAPERMGVTTYEVLSAEHKELVDKAITGERLVNVAEERSDLPGEPVVRKDGTYYVFNTYATFDWLDQNTLIPLGIFGLGLYMAIFAIRRDLGTKSLV